MNRPNYTLPTRVWPIGSLQRSLAEAEVARLTGARVDARDLGSVESATPSASGRPFVVVTAQLRWNMGWTPTTPDEVRLHKLMDVVEPTLDAEAMNEADHAQAVLSHDDRETWLAGADADDWDTDDGPANDGDDEELDADLERLRVAREAGKPDREPGFPYHVHNPFTARQTWFATFAAALAYARAASAADVLDGDLGVWSASGWGEYRLFKGGAPHAEA